ncbi:MAG TPA: SDR family NAD(P)-dependent oxidoreductase, partial [Acidimicrobiia bacterium]
MITGAGSGIGAAMAQRFAAEGPRALVLADLDLDSAREVAAGTGGTALQVDVADPASNDRMIDEAEDRFGPVDLFCA